MVTTVLKRLFFIGIASIVFMQALQAQDSKEDKKVMQAEAVKKMVNDQKYVFKVQSVTPMKGGTRQLSSGYTLKVFKDSVISDLPYFGRLYQANLGTAEGGIKFASTDFAYSAKERKKGGWDITIRPKDAKIIQDIYLTIFENGSSSVDINCNDRQPISFNGFVEEPK